MNDIQEVSIKNYRAIDEISFTPRPINILVGPNNSGKSSILEAVALLKSSENGCKDSLGVYVLGEIIKKYSLDYLFHDVNKSIQISYGELSLSIKHFSEGYPKDTDGSRIQDYFIGKIHEYLIQPDTISRFTSRFSQDKKYRSDSSKRVQQSPLDGAFFSERQPHLEYNEEKSGFIEETFEDYIQYLHKKLESDLFHRKKIVLSGHSENALVFLYVVFSNVDVRFLRQREESFEFLRDYTEGFIEIYSIGKKPTGFVSDFDTDRNARRVDKLHDEVVRRNLISDAHSRIISKIPSIEDIRKTDEGLFISLGGQDRSLPLSSMGDGFKSMLKIIYLSVLAKKGVITLEEPEVSLHPGYIEMLADAILFCSNNTQFFISTHSKDLIESLLDVAQHHACLDSVQVIKMHPRLDTHVIEAEVLSGVEALEDIETINADLRGI